MQILNLFRKDDDFLLFLRYVAVVHWNICSSDDFATISYYTNIAEDDCEYIYNNFDTMLDEYKHRKELEYFLNY